MTTFSSEQFNMLLEAFKSKNASFSSCTARYNGERNPSKVEEFLAAVSTFKNIEKISDADAIEGMPMLLEDDASEWWRGVKSKATSFEEVIKMLRDAFCPPKPNWRIYAEIFEVKQQKNEPTDTFIRKKRSLFAQIKPLPQESVQIDILFGMLHAQIREKVLRHSIKTFEDLLTNAREAEYCLIERGLNLNTESAGNGPVRCSFCRKKGHTVEKCYKKLKQEEEVKQSIIVAEKATPIKPKLACYGCNAPGYIRANCPTCSGKPSSSKDFVSFNSLSIESVSGTDIPTVNIQMFGVPGQAFFDSGARTSVASKNLKRVMDMQGCKYKKVKCKISLADGSKSVQNCLATECKILIGRRRLDIQFIILPNATNNRTLLGADFLEQSGIVLNLGQKCWYFEDSPFERFDFAEALPLKMNLIETIKVSGNNKRRPDESLTNLPKQSCNDVYMSEFEDYGPDFEGSHYSPHVIQAIFRDSLPFDMKTPEREENDGLFTGVVYVGDCNETATINLGLAEFKYIKDLDAPHLPTNYKDKLEVLLSTHEKVFDNSDEPTPYAEHFINTANHEPISSPPYSMSFAKTRELKQEIDKMLSTGIIEECESPWAAPVVMVPKKGGGIRVCLDYRKLNAITIPDKYPLPRIDDLLHAAKSTLFMTTLDLQSGYYQVKVADKDVDKTCFTTPFGLFRFTRMPFGLRNAPATFQRLIDKFKSALPDVAMFAYLDDIIICSATFYDHLRDLNKVFEGLRKFKLHINSGKCRFCCSEIRYLGHILTQNGICVDPGKTSAIAQRKEPRNVKELLSFLQTCSWYRKFINNYSHIAKPLTNLLKKNSKWIWGNEQNNAFCKLKEALTTSPVLKQAQDDLPFIIKTDASAYALGAVLLQGERNEEHPIEFASRLLTDPEKNYSTTEREALAIVWACAKFRGYIEGAKVILATDHQPLKWLFGMKTPTGRLARWALQIQPYNFEIEYTPGKTNTVADMLSRPPSGKSVETHRTHVLSFQIDFPKKGVAEIRKEQLEDEKLKAIIESIENNDENLNRWVNRGYLINDGVLFCYSNDETENAQLVLPEHVRTEILKIYHDESTASHYGVERTMARIASRYYWPGMRADITKHIKTCSDCQRYKATNLKPAGLLQTTSSRYRFEVLSVDLFGPLPKTNEGYQWILIAEDVASRWVEIFPMMEATAGNCAKLLIEEVFFRYGLPRRLKTDNGVQFISAIMQKVTFCLGIQQQFTPVYHPEANPVERKNRDMKAQLAILVQGQHNTWSDNLFAIRFAMNTAKCQSTGYTAAFLTFGRELRTLDDVTHDVKAVVEKENFIPEITGYLRDITKTFKRARENEQRQQDKNQMLSNQHRRPQIGLELGTEVLINTHVLSQAAKGLTSKFVPKRDGPYVIRKRLGATTYEVAARVNPDVPLGAYHASALIVYKGDMNELETHPLHPLKKRGRPRKQ